MPDESAPKPGHFLPGGAGDKPAETGGKTAPVDPMTGKAEPLAAPTPRLGATAAPPGPPLLSGTRLGPPLPGDLASAAFRARYKPEPIPYVPRKRSKLLIAGIVAATLVVVGGGVTVAAKVLKNKLYSTGKLAPSKCKEPHEGDETACGPTDQVAQYCDADDGSIFQAWTNRRDEAPNEAARLLENRRSALQAACFSSVYLGTDKASFPLQGQLLEAWQYASRHGGDENSKDKVRDHGSRKNVELWMQRGFTGIDPASCNTFAATADKVS